MANSPVVVRICGFNGESKDWMVPSDITFRMVLVSPNMHMDTEHGRTYEHGHMFTWVHTPLGCDIASPAWDQSFAYGF